MRRTLLTLAALFVMFAVLTPAANADDAMPPGDQVAAVDQSQGLWYLRNDDGSATSFYFGDPGDIPIFGDWNGDSEMTPGVYRQSDGRIYLRNSNTQGIADLFFFFGNPDDVPIAGDWDGDGVDTISVFRPATNEFFIINELGANGGGLGAADYSFTFGDEGDIPLSGDWDGDGVDGIAMYRASTGEFFWRNALSTGAADGSRYFGDIGDNPIAGDWDGDGDDEFGTQRGSTWYLEGVAGSFEFGEAGWFPVAGFFMSQVNTGRLNIYETARAAGGFTTLLAAVDAAGLDGALKGPGPLTVFAPTDDAFAALPDGTVEALLADIPLLTRILQYHVAAGEVDSGAVVGLDGSYAQTIGGELVWVTVEDGKVILNTDSDKAEVIVVDIQASNGIIHVIDTVLVPKDIPTVAAEAGLTTLLAALEAGGLDEAVAGPNGPFTVFAPTNDAFAALGGTLTDLLQPENLADLQRILTYHVASGVATAEDVIGLDGWYIETLGGEIVWIEVVGGKVILNGVAEVLVTDVKTSNGIVHVIDTVLVPKDIVETAVDAGFSTLAFALTEAGLVDAVSAPNGPFTVFAPTNAAFDAVDDDLLAAVLADPSGLLTSVLTYHVISGAVLSGDVVALAPGDTPATLQGQTIAVADDLTLNAPGDATLGINGATLGPLDIKTSNGVIHVIDRVLVPAL
ncbi:MAG TPA: fasciclin domain-containing protein [Acidimicrobiia bacterium]|nr:fasciclin domain-containing protein [Acidimicrobiia bacterium]